MIDEQHAFQVIHLVLNADSEQTLGVLDHFLAIIIEIFELHARGPFHLVEYLWDRKAALFVGRHVHRRPKDFRIYEIARLLRLIAARQIHHDDALRHADLDGRQPDAGRVVHRLQHVIHELAVLIGDAAFHRGGDELQGRVRHREDFANSHHSQL